MGHVVEMWTVVPQVQNTIDISMTGELELEAAIF